MSDLLCIAIEKRFSCRLFDTNKSVPPEAVDRIILAASKAPSGKNGQPWRFRILTEEDIQVVAEVLPQNKWFSKVKQCIAVFLDSDKIYDVQKDTLAVGACIENLILEATANDIQSCWISECTAYSDKINYILEIESRYNLLALIALGYGRQIGAQPEKLAPHEFMI